MKLSTLKLSDTKMSEGAKYYFQNVPLRIGRFGQGNKRFMKSLEKWNKRTKAANDDLAEVMDAYFNAESLFWGVWDLESGDETFELDTKKKIKVRCLQNGKIGEVEGTEAELFGAFNDGIDDPKAIRARALILTHIPMIKEAVTKASKDKDLFGVFAEEATEKNSVASSDGGSTTAKASKPTKP